MPSTNGHTTNPERVALYIRVSSEEQRDAGTIQTQSDSLMRHAAACGFEVAEVYADDGVSGTIPLHERPEGRRLLEDAKEGKFEAVLVYKLDRLGRTLLVIVDAHDRLQEAGVALRSATEPIDTSTPSGRLIFQMLASFAEYERGTIRERTQAGQRRAFKNGRQMGAIPYGYDIAPDNSFVVVEDEARIVREIIANIAGGATLYSEAKRLNDEGVPSPGHRYRGKPRKHGASWGHTTIREIIQQRAYVGTHVIKINGGAETIERPVPAIVALALRDKALRRLEENKRFAGGRRRRNYLLSGLVVCAHCGWTYRGTTATGSRTKRRYHYYGCGKRRSTHDKRYRGYSWPQVNAEWLEDLVWADVRSFLENPGEVLERVREQLEGDDQAHDLDERRESLWKRLASKQAERDRAMRLYMRDLISEEEAAVLLADLKNQADNLRLLIKSVESDLSKKEESKMLAASTEAWLMTIRERIAEVEEDTQEAYLHSRELVKLLVEKITADRDEDGRVKVDITYRFGPPTGEDVLVGVQDSAVPDKEDRTVEAQKGGYRRQDNSVRSLVKDQADREGEGDAEGHPEGRQGLAQQQPRGQSHRRAHRRCGQAQPPRDGEKTESLTPVAEVQPPSMPRKQDVPKDGVDEN
jgi:site-specific DNA recombinase